MSFAPLKANGVAAVVVVDYILGNSGGMGAEVYDDKVVVFNHSWKTKQTSLKKVDRIKGHVRQKYEKLNNAKSKEFHNLLAYMAITQETADCCTVTKIIKTKPTPVSMIELIKKALVKYHKHSLNCLWSKHNSKA